MTHAHVCAILFTQVWGILDWLLGHEAEAERMGLAARAFALKYLSVQARTCYWYTLLRQYAPLLRYSVAAKYSGSAHAGHGRDDEPHAGEATTLRAGRPPVLRWDLRSNLISSGKVCP